MQALLLAVRLWAAMPEDLRSACSLLPSDCQPPPATFFSPLAARTEGDSPSAAADAAAAFFQTQHLQALLPVLRQTSRAHPRLHSVWPTLLALLFPGFTAQRVWHHEAMMISMLLRTERPFARMQLSLV